MDELAASTPATATGDDKDYIDNFYKAFQNIIYLFSSKKNSIFV